MSKPAADSFNQPNASFDNRLRPTTFDDFVGQEKVRERLLLAESGLIPERGKHGLAAVESAVFQLNSLFGPFLDRHHDTSVFFYQYNKSLLFVKMRRTL